MAENPKHAEAAELHQRSVDLWLGDKRDKAIAVYRQALGLESDAISLQLRDTLPNSYSDPDATPNAPINLQQQNAFAAYRNTIRLTTDDARAWFNIGLTHEKEGRATEAGQAFVESFKSYHRTHAAKTLQASGKAAVEVCRRVVEIDPRDAKAWINLGAALGQAICTDSRVRKISFTGSADVGEQICRMAGLKRVTMELGSNSPVIVLDDADPEKVATTLAVTGFANAGQVCISSQRVIATPSIHDDLLDALKAKVGQLTAGDQLAEGTNVGPLVREADARRVEEWLGQARDQGAELLCGGDREGSVVQPAVLANVNRDMRMSCDELFGPAVGVTRADSIDDAIRLANDTRYGLSASIFTQDIDKAIRFAREVDSGNLHINFGTAWRAETMPYGGLKDSGMGKEGPRYAVEEMSETKMVVIHGK